MAAELAPGFRVRIGQFVAYYDHERYHEPLNNLMPADVNYDSAQSALDRGEKIKLETLAMRNKRQSR